ncbi:MAG: peptidoglycan-binding protein [bacterium]
MKKIIFLAFFLLIFIVSGFSFANAVEIGVINAPALSTPKPLSISSIRWNLLDNSTNEIGFKLFNSQDNTVILDSPTGITYFDETGLAENTQYTRYVKAYNDLGESATSSTVSAYTLANDPTSLIPANVASTSILVSTPAFSNVAAGGSGYYFVNITQNIHSGWTKSNSWQNNNLPCATFYSYSVKYRNGDGVETNPFFISTSTASCKTETPLATTTASTSTSTSTQATTTTTISTSTTAASTSTITYLQSEVARITALIQTLTAQLLASQPVKTNGLSVNMGLGGRGYQIKTLQSWLSQDKTIYPEGKITGYFGQLTVAAVKRFQTKYASEVLAPRGLTVPDGIVETYTRTKLNSLFAK